MVHQVGDCEFHSIYTVGMVLDSRGAQASVQADRKCLHGDQGLAGGLQGIEDIKEKSRSSKPPEDAFPVKNLA
jgi:hypothetical protein